MKGLLWFSFNELQLLHFNGFMLEVLSRAFIASLVCCYNFLQEVTVGRLIDLVFNAPNLPSLKSVTQVTSNLNKPWTDLEPFWSIKAQYFSACDFKEDAKTWCWSKEKQSTLFDRQCYPNLKANTNTAQHKAEHITRLPDMSAHRPVTCSQYAWREFIAHRSTLLNWVQESTEMAQFFLIIQVSLTQLLLEQESSWSSQGH